MKKETIYIVIAIVVVGLIFYFSLHKSKPINWVYDGSGKITGYRDDNGKFIPKTS